jgi:hypothetical protein
MRSSPRALVFKECSRNTRRGESTNSAACFRDAANREAFKRVSRISGMGDLLRGRAGTERWRRAADGCQAGCAPCWWRDGAALLGTRRPRWPPRGRQQGRGRLWQRDCSRLNTTPAGVAPGLQPAQASRVGSARCCTMARTALGAVRYANTRRLPPQHAQVKTSTANVLLSNSAQSTRGVLSFFGSLLTPTAGFERRCVSGTGLSDFQGHSEQWPGASGAREKGAHGAVRPGMRWRASWTGHGRHDDD